MTQNKKSDDVPVTGTTKHLKSTKPHMTVGDVIVRCIKTRDPVPEYYRDLDPEEIIAIIENE